MQKKYMVMFMLLLLIILFSGCGGDSTSAVPSVNTPTPVIQATPTGMVTQVLSTLTELEAKRVTISAKDGGKVTEGNMTVEIPGNSLETDTSVEIAKVTINGVSASGREGVTEEYKISTGKDDVYYELKEPSTVKITADNNKIPVIWSGGAWLPVDYDYDAGTGEIVMKLNSLDEDINEWTEEGGEMGKIEGPLVVGVRGETDYKLSTSSTYFKVFYCNKEDENYAKSVAVYLEKAYDFYKKLNYNEPLKTMLKSGDELDCVNAYIYPAPSDPNYAKTTDGIASTGGYMLFNKNRVDINKPMGQSVCYHELLHLIQYSYINGNAYPQWFDESMAVCMEYYGINKPGEMYDLADDKYWTPDIFTEESFSYVSKDETFYEKYPFWSYIINKEKPEVLHNIMKEFNVKPYAIEDLNDIFQRQLKKDFVTYFNEFAEDFYMGGTFFNKTYFNKLKDRTAEQPYSSFLIPEMIPHKVSKNVSVNPLSVKYLFYEFFDNSGTYKFELSGKLNCKVKFFYLKSNNGIFSVTNEDVGDMKEIDNSVSKLKEVFILVENTTVNSKAAVTVDIMKSEK